MTKKEKLNSDCSCFGYFVQTLWYTEQYKTIWIVFFVFLSTIWHLIVVEGFMVPSDPRGFVVWGLLPPGKVPQNKLVLGDKPDKVQFQRAWWEVDQGNSLGWG